MTSMLNTTARVLHATPIPSTVSIPKAISILQLHELVIKCDPHMIKYEPVPVTTPHPEVAPERQVAPVAEAKCYQVIDRVRALPAGLWDSDVESIYECISVEKGVFVRIRSPLSVVIETVWEIRENEMGDGYELVEELVVKCSRFLVGIVKSQCEAHYESIHQKMIKHMEENS